MQIDADIADQQALGSQLHGVLEPTGRPRIGGDELLDQRSRRREGHRRLPGLEASDLRIRPVRGEHLHVVGTKTAQDEALGGEEHAGQYPVVRHCSIGDVR